MFLIVDRSALSGTSVEKHCSRLLAEKEGHWKEIRRREVFSLWALQVLRHNQPSFHKPPVCETLNRFNKILSACKNTIFFWIFFSCHLLNMFYIGWLYDS
jgi:hypothetical protein